MNDYRPAIIASSSSVAGVGAIAVLRISGDLNFNNFQKFFKVNLSKIEERYCYYTKILDGSSVLDEILLVFFKGPRSFTGEDVLEIHAHGNRLNIKNILDLFIKNGACRMAKKGEFAHRAFLNKKISLIQAEGLERIINAKTPLALSSGMSLLSGKLNQQYTELFKLFLKLKSALELGIDFLEDVGEEGHHKILSEALFQLGFAIKKLHQQAKHFNKELLSPHVAVFGIPNAGKSSFFNCVLGSDRSIVSDIPGTTRDYISEYLEFDSTTVMLLDTAGVRQSSDLIENFGIKKTLALYEKSLFRVLVVNPFDKDFFITTNPLINMEFDLIVFSHCEDIFSTDPFLPFVELLKGERFVFCSFKENGKMGPVSLQTEAGPIGPVFKKYEGPIAPLLKKFSGPIGPLAKNLAGPIGPLSCLNPVQVSKDQLILSSGPIGPGCNLLQILEKIVLYKIGQVSPDGVVAERHVSVIEQLFFEWNIFLDKTSKQSDIAILLSDLVLVEETIAELVGQIASEDVLNNIFDNFCIGK